MSENCQFSSRVRRSVAGAITSTGRRRPIKCGRLIKRADVHLNEGNLAFADQVAPQ